MRWAEALVRRLRALSLRVKVWWVAGLVFLLGSLATTDSCLGVLFTLALVLWAIPTLTWGFYRLWVRITYRISVRLFLSYLLIGVLPFPLILGLLVFAGYVLIGQYASSDFGDTMSRVEEGLARMVEDALAAAESSGAEGARAVFQRGPAWPESMPVNDQVEWFFAPNGETGQVFRGAKDGDLSIPQWMDGEVEAGPFWHGEDAMVAAIARRGDQLAVAALRFSDEVDEGLSRDYWYKVQFTTHNQQGDDDTEENDVSRKADSPETDGPEADGSETGDSETDGPEADGTVEDGTVEDDNKGFWNGFWNNRWIFFARVVPNPRLWSDGIVQDDDNFTALIRTSPREAAADLFRVPSDFRQALWGSFLVMCLTFLFIYLVAVGLAALYIMAITGATSRLTRGALQVQAGHLDYRIPVKRRDQLGDLAVAFNQMTESVGSMLGEVAEKERLKNELELAREIQQSLLPERQLRHGSIVVHAYFRPAAEVGGDYFDLFPLEHGHLIVAVGDVAGHGLPTGLLMAMIKSAVATLIQEGHRGVEILQRVNHFMLKQPRAHRMVTLAVAEIDTRAGVAKITNAAHPPVYLSGGSVREVLLPALPVGYQWPKPPPTETIELTPGSRLVFYSDGLVEAVNKNDEQFGYERLKSFLEEHVERGSEELRALLLKELEEHTGGRALDDDLTLLVIDCGISENAEESANM